MRKEQGEEGSDGGRREEEDVETSKKSERVFVCVYDMQTGIQR